MHFKITHILPKNQITGAILAFLSNFAVDIYIHKCKKKLIYRKSEKMFS